MDPAQMYRTYERRAKQAVSPTVRTVNMLGMMCAAAVAQGGFFAFVGKGYGGDWPNPCEPDDATQTTQDGAARPQTRTEEA